MSEAGMVEGWYVIDCKECDEGGVALPIPFDTPEARGRWAADHRNATGHDRWLVIDHPREPLDGVTSATSEGGTASE